MPSVTQPILMMLAVPEHTIIGNAIENPELPGKKEWTVPVKIAEALSNGKTTRMVEAFAKFWIQGRHQTAGADACTISQDPMTGQGSEPSSTEWHGPIWEVKRRDRTDGLENNVCRRQSGEIRPLFPVEDR